MRKSKLIPTACLEGIYPFWKTGSRKSCTVAGLIQWSLEEAKKATNQNINARFIVLDPNGEYTKTFENARVFGSGSAGAQLKVPLWFWNSEEWCSFVQASGKSQRPLLRRALREIRSGIDPLAEATSDDARKQEMRRYLSSQIIGIRRDLRSNAIKTDTTKFGFSLRAIKDDLELKKAEVADCTQEIEETIRQINAALTATFKSFAKDGKTVEYYQAFTEQQVAVIVNALGAAINKLGGIVYQDGPGENTPIPFDAASFADHLEVLADQENISQFIDALIIRIAPCLPIP